MLAEEMGHYFKTTFDTYTHFGSEDIKVDKLESYYDAVKGQNHAPETRINRGFQGFNKNL